MRRLNEDKIKTMYVKDAVVYEDQPSTLKDTFKRYKRMARALNSLFYTQGIKSFFLFFARWKWTYIDMFLTHRALSDSRAEIASKPTIADIPQARYARDNVLVDIFVVADNCTDNTAEIARAAGAIVYE